VISQQVMSLRAAAADVAPEVLASVTAPVHLGALGLVSVDEATGEIRDAARSSRETAILVPLIIMMMMFAVVIMSAQPLMQSVLEEKMQRIAEVLLGSVSPFQLMMGKLLGTVGVSFTVVGVYVIGGVVAADRTGARDFVPYEIIPWVFAFQVGAVFMYGAVFSAIGAACNDLKEAQSLMTPVMVLLMMPMFVMINIIREPLSGFATGLSLFPMFTPLLMLMRQSSPTAIPEWQPWAGLAGVALFTVLCVWAAGRIFRIGLLMQGKPPRIQDLVRWAVRG
jgi:ABC-type Na+ efflux pump permease subunit